MSSNIQLFNQDCMVAMKEMPDKAFDLAIVDPPYGIGDFRQTKSKKHHKDITWNDHTPTEEYFKQLERVTKNRIIWGIPYYAKYVNDVGRIVHDKTGGGRRLMPTEFSDCDIASHSFGVNMRIFHYVHVGNVSGPPDHISINWDNSNRIHPCQKPIFLYQWCLKRYAKPGDKILDTHLGSGSIAIACYDMGHDLVGYEIDKDYFEAAQKRLENHKKQLTLF